MMYLSMLKDFCWWLFVSVAGTAVIVLCSPSIRKFDLLNDDANEFERWGYSSNDITCSLDKSGRAKYCITDDNKMTNGYKYNNDNMK
ncbi:hypothetical protein [Photobacterium carnosum]|uniref:hypothetical protein n=1 Tax=Photobacterium carnosum TaxID=2023717 RepID=UPI001E475160|nr:hypothetical protein [Photobacterium carnosum]MCD9499349.1 hypothetical protein [Photobacterium carnosum]